MRYRRSIVFDSLLGHLLVKSGTVFCFLQYMMYLQALPFCATLNFHAFLWKRVLFYHIVFHDLVAYLVVRKADVWQLYLYFYILLCFNNW